MDNQRLKRQSVPCVSHGQHGQSSSVETAVSGEDKMISIGLCQLPGQWVPARLSPSPSVYYSVCFAPFAEEDGGQAADSHDRWQSVCVCACLFSTSFFFPQRSLSQARSIQHHRLTTTFNPMGPTGLGCEVFDWFVTTSLIHMHQTHKAGSVKYVQNASSYFHISIIYEGLHVTASS